MATTDISPPLPESGSLMERSVPGLILDLYRARFNGSLELSRVRATKTFVFVNGAPATSESSQASETLVAHLHERELLTGEQRQQVDEYVGTKGCKEAAALLALKLVDSKILFQSLKELTRRRILDCCSWSGLRRFDFVDSSGRERVRESLQQGRPQPRAALVTLAETKGLPVVLGCKRCFASRARWRLGSTAGESGSGSRSHRAASPPR